MKISIDTEQDSFGAAIDAVHAAYGIAKPPTDAGVIGTGEAELPGGWTRKTLRLLAEWVGGEEAAVALRFIGSNAPSVSIDETIAHVARLTEQPGFDGKAMGGKMSAIGKFRARKGQGAADLVERDFTSRLYRMDPEVALVLLEEMDSVGLA